MVVWAVPRGVWRSLHLPWVCLGRRGGAEQEPWVVPRASAAASAPQAPQVCACHWACRDVLAHRVGLVVRACCHHCLPCCHRGELVCRRVQVCCHLGGREHQGGQGNQGERGDWGLPGDWDCPVVGEHRCRGAEERWNLLRGVAPVCLPVQAVVWAGWVCWVWTLHQVCCWLQACSVHPVGLGTLAAGWPQVALEHPFGPRSGVLTGSDQVQAWRGRKVPRLAGRGQAEQGQAAALELWAWRRQQVC